MDYGNITEACPRCGTTRFGGPASSHGLCSVCLFESIMDTDPDRDLPEPGRERAADCVGRYQLAEKIGEGGFGCVYVAEQTEPVRRRVALKILKPGMDSERVIARFEAERHALARMEHPNIARVLDAGTAESGRPYFVMELVEGVPITTYCREQGLGLRARLELFLQVCAAVQHAHQKGIIHRDLKPTNILVTVIDQAPVPKVIDFGIAKATGESPLMADALQTQSHQLLGTPIYMSPEQVALGAADIDTRSDIYSLGVVLYELLSGTTPFEARELAALGFDGLRRHIREAEPEMPSRRLRRLSLPASGRESPTDGRAIRKVARQGIDPDMDWVVMKCLEKEPARRYASAHDLAEDLERLLRHEPVSAGPSSAVYRLGKLFRRHRLAVGAAAAVLCTIVVALAATTTLLLRERRSRLRALAAERLQEASRRQAEEARAQAESANQRLTSNLRELQWRRAEELVTGLRRPDALALWARLLRDQPEDASLATRLTSALSERSSALPHGAALPHGGMVTLVQFSPAGDRLLTAADDGWVRLWDPASGERLLSLSNGPARQVTFTPDGRRVMLSALEGRIRFWDCLDGRLLSIAPGHSPLHSPAHPRVAVLLSGGEVTFWDSETGRPAGQKVAASDRALATAWNLDGESIVVGGADGRLRTWSPDRGEWIREYPSFEGGIRTLVMSPDGTRLIAGTTGGTLVILDPRTGREVSRFREPDKEVLLAVISPDSRFAATYHYSDPIRVWNLDNGTLRNRVGADQGGVADLAFSPDGGQLGIARHSGLAEVWDVVAGEALLEPIEHEGPVAKLAFHPGGAWLATASQDTTARLWDVRMRRPWSPPWSADGPVRRMQFDRDGRRLLVAAAKGASLVEPDRGARLTPVMGSSHGVQTATLSPNGRWVAIAAEDHQVRLWEADTGLPTGQPMPHVGVVWQVDFSPDSGRIVTASRDHHVRVFDVATQALVAQVRQPSEIFHVKFSPDGRRVLSTCVDGGLRLHDAASLALVLPPMMHKGIVWMAEFSPDGRRILSGSADRTARLWDAGTGQPLGALMRHPKGVQMAHFSADGRRVITGSEDGTARVWDGLTGEPVSAPIRSPVPKPLTSVSLSPDARWALVTDSQEGYLYDARTGLSVSESMTLPGGLSGGIFFPDGKRVLIFSQLGTGRVWPVVDAPAPVAPWLAELVEGVAGRRLDEHGELHLVPPEPLQRLRDRLVGEEGTSTDFYSRWGRWLLTERLTPHPPDAPVP